MDRDRVDQIIQFALLAAGRNDEPFERELGPIHLIKYVYLADLAHAERHAGETFTDAAWQFFHYGPWAQEVHERIESALLAIDAEQHVVSSKYGDDFVRWSKVDDELFEKLESALPVHVGVAVRRHVRQFGKDTAELLHYVYATAPMVRAAPRSRLSFADLSSAEPSAAPPQSARPELTAKQKKKHDERMRDAKMQIASKLAAKRTAQAEKRVAPPPRYDDVFVEGVRWLDSLAGDATGELEGEASFTDDVWTSAARAERRDG